MNELALFAGAGGGILGTHLLGWRPVAAVEINSYCREVLLRRQRDRVLPLFPIWDDIRTFDGRPLRGRIDVVTAGFPCQPFSEAGRAGRRKGGDDNRNMWPDTIRIIREVGPRYCLLENVADLLTHDYARGVFGELAESGYDCRWDCIPAAAIGAPHHRDRLWILAHKNADTNSNRLQGRMRQEPTVGIQTLGCKAVWPDIPTPRGLGTRNGVADSVDRLRAIGNGQVPGVVRAAWLLLGHHADHDSAGYEGA